MSSYRQSNEPWEGLSPEDRRLYDYIADLARNMDQGVKIPGVPFRVPLDPLIGLVPGIGDAIPFAIGLGIIHSAGRLGVPGRLQRKMFRNLLLDAALGLVPLAGDVADYFFKANLRNLRLVDQHLATRGSIRTVTADSIE